MDVCLPGVQQLSSGFIRSPRNHGNQRCECEVSGKNVDLKVSEFSPLASDCNDVNIELRHDNVIQRVCSAGAQAKVSDKHRATILYDSKVAQSDIVFGFKIDGEFIENSNSLIK